MHLAMLLECCVSLLLQCIILTGAQSEDIDCQNTAYGRSCTLPNAPERTALIGDRLYVGITNELLAFQLLDQKLVDVDRVNLSPSVNRSNICEFDQLNDGALCENYIRVIQLIPEAEDAPAQLLVCGTNAFFPKCRLHDPTDLSNWVFMTPEEHSDDGFTPFANTRPNVGVLASNDRFFSGTFFSAYGSERAIGMAPHPLEGDSTFTLETPSSNTRWLHRPDFVSVYEHGDYIYFFVREPAYEVDMGRTVVYSRAIRLCKNDDGMTDQTQMIFLTFQKARITCTNNGGTNTIPYHYDNLKATYLWQSDSGEQTLYGAFSAPEFGPEGTAICKFSFNDIARVFEDGLYLIPSAEDNNVWVRTTAGSFSCPGTGGQQRTDQHATDYQLVFNTINAMEPEPLHEVSGEEVTQIAVDFINYGGVENEILYYSTNSGEIRQLVIAGSESYEHTILTIPSENAIRSLDVYQGDNEIRYLFLSTGDSVLSVPRGDCSRYTDCFSCLDSKDAYCGWNTTISTPSCVNKLFTSNPLIESVSSTETVITETCGPRSTTTPTQPSPVPSSCPNTVPTETDSQPTSTASSSTGTSENPPTNQCGTPSVGPVGGLDNSDESQISFSIPELVGSTVGGLVVGVLIGLLVCGVFFKLFVKGRNDSKSEERGTGTVPLQHVPSTVTNNQLIVNVQKKEQNHYVDQQPATHSTMEQQPEKKDLNRYESPEEDDAIAPLSSFQQNGSRSHRSSRSPPKPRPKPTRNRTESTRELMGSVSSEPSSDSIEFNNSPLDSPV